MFRMMPSLAVGWFLIPSPIYSATTGSEPLSVAVISDRAPPTSGAELLAALTRRFGIKNTLVALNGDESPSASSLASVHEADAVLFFRGPGASANLPALRQILDSGAGLVLLAVDPGAWPAELPPSDLIGASPRGVFAAGARLSVINLFPHAALTGIETLETDQAVPRYEKLADDAQLLIEGTAGEVVTPLAWARRRANGRVFHLALAGDGLFTNPAYQRLVANALLWTSARPIPGARPAVQRTFMPESYPGAFAITFPNGPGVCLDPVRGGINYLWDGDFVDLRPRWLTKQGEPARPFGDVFYREKQWQPLRAGAPDSPPDLEFRGYALHDGYPEFHYTVGGREVRERLTASAGGGLVRHFRVGAGSAPLWFHLEPQADADVLLRGLERDGHVASFSSKEEGEFTIEIRRRRGVLP